MQAMLDDGLAFGPTLDGELLVRRTIDRSPRASVPTSRSCCPERVT